MANEKGKLKLLGYWFSAYCKRVELALNAKGIPFEYQEEDLTNKSELLLKSNPVKKVPVVLHNGTPICESLIILEYIDETWTNSPKLLPEDSATRSNFRFWASFFHIQLFDSLYPVVTSEGEEQEKAFSVYSANLKTVEEGIAAEFFGSGGGREEIKSEENLNLVDVVIWSVLGWYKAFESIELNILDADKYPLTYSWVTKLNNLSVVKKTAADTAKVASEINFFRNLGLQKVAAHA
ncbi:hypothetical protein M9H77_02658 [Catharanthus roseus]|uniref:Uncharacterized protein n=1 Tax=Catharanthus roseus TaxID=4058 RepID=A0ACC0C976_CATRO|nr:hypothetical protein M9H77_02658 [Catharanthus roseus]